jgi:hypothetical protein
MYLYVGNVTAVTAYCCTLIHYFTFMKQKRINKHI